jgi:hypothetical protein
MFLISSSDFPENIGPVITLRVIIQGGVNEYLKLLKIAQGYENPTL